MLAACPRVVPPRPIMVQPRVYNLRVPWRTKQSLSLVLLAFSFNPAAALVSRKDLFATTGDGYRIHIREVRAKVHGPCYPILLVHGDEGIRLRHPPREDCVRSARATGGRRGRGTAVLPSTVRRDACLARTRVPPRRVFWLARAERPPGSALGARSLELGFPMRKRGARGGL